MISQLRQSGMLDAVKLIQAGYPTRIPYESIHSRYKDIMPPEVGGLPPEQFCEVIAEVCGVGKSEYYLGVNRMFFRMGSAAFLEELQDADPEMMKPILLQKLAEFERKKNSIPVIEKCLLMWVHKRRYRVLLEEKRKKEEEERRKEEERQRREAEKKAREAEEHRRREAAEKRRRDEEEKRRKEQEEKERIEAEKGQLEEYKAKMAEEKRLKELDAQKAAKTLGDVEAMINALEQDADLEQEIQGDRREM